METRNIIIFGASGHGSVIADSIAASGEQVPFIIDDQPKSATLAGVEVIHSNKVQLSSEDQICIGIGNNKVRKAVAGRLAGQFCTVAHPTSILSSSATIGAGTVLMAGAIVNTGAVIGQHCIINTAAIIEHDCEIGDFAHISPNAALAGNVRVGEGAHVGIGACVIQGTTIGKWATIGAGSVIIRDVPDYAVVVGNPGRVLKYNEP